MGETSWKNAVILFLEDLEVSLMTVVLLLSSLQVLCYLLPASGLQEQDDSVAHCCDAWRVLGNPDIYFFPPYHARLE